MILTVRGFFGHHTCLVFTLCSQRSRRVFMNGLFRYSLTRLLRWMAAVFGLVTLQRCIMGNFTYHAWRLVVAPWGLLLISQFSSYQGLAADKLSTGPQSLVSLYCSHMSAVNDRNPPPDSGIPDSISN